MTALVGEHDRIRLTATGNLAAAARALGDLPTVRRVTVAANAIDLLDEDASTALPRILAATAAAGAVVQSVNIAEPDLEAVFLHLTGKRLRD